MSHLAGLVPRALAALLCALSIAACAPPTGERVQTAPPPVPEPERLAAVTWDASADADSIARWALRGCRAGDVGARRGCVEGALKSVLATAGVAKAMAALDLVAARDEGLVREAHGLAHGLGIAAYRGEATMARDFAACPATQISGCYHGVIQGWFLDLRRRGAPADSAALNALCEPHRGGAVLFIQCAHGMGHGLMSFHAGQLPAALESCARVRDPLARENCYGGVFMENVVAATHPEHTAEAHAGVSAPGDGGHAAHGGGHAHGSADGGERTGGGWKALDPADPLYPCTAVAHRYRWACYGIQTAAVLHHNGGDVAATAAACSGAGGGFIPVCWRSLGRDLTAYAGRDPARTAALCARAGEAARPDCVRGAAEALVQVASDPEAGLALCRAVEGDPARTACHHGVGRTLFTLFPERPRREAVCAALDPAHVETCRRGADLPPR